MRKGGAGVIQPFPAGGLGGGGRCKRPEPRRQTHFGNNLFKIGLNSGLWVAVYTPIFDCDACARLENAQKNIQKY